MVAALKDQGLSSEWYYTTSTNRDDKSISMGGTQPDTGRNVHGLKNTVSLLVETRGRHRSPACPKTCARPGRGHDQCSAQCFRKSGALWNRFAPLSSKTHLPKLAATKSS